MLYAIGDLHLSFSNDKPMDVFGEVWQDHAQKLKRGFASLTAEDVTVLCGDLSWAMSLPEALEDFRFIDALPGKKIVLKGNHDYWWSTAAKAKKLFAENGIETIDILHNNALPYGEYALCGTRGWFYEEERGVEHDRKIMRREVMRLENSLRAAGSGRSWSFCTIRPFTRNTSALRSWSFWSGTGSKNAFTGISTARAFPPPSTAGAEERSSVWSPLTRWDSRRCRFSRKVCEIVIDFIKQF